MRIGQQPIGESIDECEEDLALAGEMEIDSALGAAGGGGDVIDACAVVTGVGKDLCGSFENALASGSLAAV